MNRLDLGLFGGPGGWAEGGRALGIDEVGIEWDRAACLTRRAAGHHVIRADVSRFPVGQLAGKVRGIAASSPCTTFSAAGDQAASAIVDLLAQLIGDMFGAEDTRAAHRQLMAHHLAASEWGADLEPGKRAAKIKAAVFSASLVAEPARFIRACRPEWVTLEQVPAVLPLWQVYAAGLRAIGYSTWTGKLNAADYGVPQTRERAILIASRVRQVSRPEPTHYDPRKGDQLWGTPWVSMAQALEFGATARPSPTVTAGGTSTGGAEPFGHRDRDALQAEQEAGRWVLGGPYRTSPGDRTKPRSMDEPATTVAFGHSNMVLRRDRGAGLIERHGNRRDHPPDEPAPSITAGVAGSGPRLSWVLRNNTQAKVQERPATTVQGDPRIGRPGHKDRDKGESQFEQDSVRITVQEAAVLQSFRPDYPWQGPRTKQFEQIGNAVPPRLAAHVLSMATGIPLSLPDEEAA